MVAFKALFIVAAAALSAVTSPLPGGDTALVARSAPGVELHGWAARDVVLRRTDDKCGGGGHGHGHGHGYGDDNDDDDDDHGHGHGKDDDDDDHGHGHGKDDDDDDDHGHGHGKGDDKDHGHGKGDDKDHGHGKGDDKDHGSGKSLAEIIVDINVQIKAHIKLIENAVKSKADIKVLIDLVVKIDVIIKAGIENVKGCKGPKTVDVNVFVDIFISIVVSLSNAVKGCGKENAKIIVQIIVQINVTISVFLKTSFGQVKDLDVKFSALLDASVVAKVKDLGLVDVIAVIKVHLAIHLRAILGA